MANDTGEERIKACLRACEGVSTEFLAQEPSEANARLQGAREKAKDVLLAKALAALELLEGCNWLDHDPCEIDDLGTAKDMASAVLGELRRANI